MPLTESNTLSITGVNAATHFINQSAFLRIKKLEKYNDLMWVYGHDVPNSPLNPRGQASLFQPVQLFLV